MKSSIGKSQQIEHHSVADWDFYIHDDWLPATWLLDTTTYVSPPSCLLIRNDTVLFSASYALSKLPQALDLKSGKMSTHSKSKLFQFGIPCFFIGVTGPGSTPIRVDIPSVDTAFRLHRVIWWQGYNPQNEPATIYHLDEYIAGSWVDGPLIYAQVLSGPINRCGVGVWNSDSYRWVYHDDTEIWIPV